MSLALPRIIVLAISVTLVTACSDEERKSKSVGHPASAKSTERMARAQFGSAFRSVDKSSGRVVVTITTTPDSTLRLCDDWNQLAKDMRVHRSIERKRDLVVVDAHHENLSDVCSQTFGSQQ